MAETKYAMHAVCDQVCTPPCFRTSPLPAPTYLSTLASPLCHCQSAYTPPAASTCSTAAPFLTLSGQGPALRAHPVTMVGCSCIPPPASLQPRKVYNILVPDVFPLQAPQMGHALSTGVEKKIEKLEEYVLKNPARIPKVSPGPYLFTRRVFMSLCVCAKLSGLT